MPEKSFYVFALALLALIFYGLVVIPFLEEQERQKYPVELKAEDLHCKSNSDCQVVSLGYCYPDPEKEDWTILAGQFVSVNNDSMEKVNVWKKRQCLEEKLEQSKAGPLEITSYESYCEANTCKMKAVLNCQHLVYYNLLSEEEKQEKTFPKNELKDLNMTAEQVIEECKKSNVYMG